MTKVYFFLSFIALLASCHAGYAQVNPPELLCHRSDTLFWNPAENTCGAFVSTNIFTSTNSDGPYTLLTSINDPNVTFYEDGTPGTNFYYLTATFDCPGLTSLSSDTLDNRNPSATRIESVSVEGEHVRIIWVENPDPETIGYVIYRSTNQGTTPIDTVMGGLEYVDQNAQPNSKSETYNVVALDACGNQGDFDASHTTIHLNVESNFCDQSLQMIWSNYEGWQNGSDNNQVWLGVDGGDIVFEHQVGPTDTLAYLLGIIDETEYCLQIVSKENGSNVLSRSNTVCLTSDVLNPLDSIEIRNVSVTSSGHIEVAWIYDAAADVDDITMFRSTDSVNYEALPGNLLESPPSVTNVFVDSEVNVETNRYFYQIRVTDACESIFESYQMSSVRMTLTTRDGGQNLMGWTPMFVQGRSLSGYSVCKIVDGVETELATLGPTTYLYTDIVEPGQETEQACYLIKAFHTKLDGGDARVSASNLQCIEQKVEMYVPNAFVPSGVNQVFKPEIIFQGSIRTYSMIVFNRWGGKVFESTNPAVGWDGSQDGEPMPGGTYLYIISIEQAEGSSEQVSGTVNLLR